ncbi:MAG: TlyA family RNA methyltransferase [Defluviitaleaceae bacterium]|nr:TlyA family RNA methyltransferase [Defluviitaleaceae bacterium]
MKKLWGLLMDKRLDVLVCEILGVSREYAKEIILAGKCEVSGKVIKKCGAKFSKDTNIIVNAKLPRFVSRGGEKLAKAIIVFDLHLQGLRCMDIGASTGGFTDCILQNGADNVIAIENGKEQLHPKLLSDERVISWENVDIREVYKDKLPFIPQFIATDLSFISIKHILPKVFEVLVEGGQAVLLVKPQFEVGRGKVNKRGVVTDEKARIMALEGICTAAKEIGLKAMGTETSPIKGQNGNVEYLLLVEK